MQIDDAEHANFKVLDADDVVRHGEHHKGGSLLTKEERSRDRRWSNMRWMAEAKSSFQMNRISPN